MSNNTQRLENPEFTITKGIIESYKIRDIKHDRWADITVDANGTTGRIQIASDYGNWQYYWGACGETFKKFLISLNLEYVAHKFGENRWFDHPKTIASLKSQVDQYANDPEEREKLLEEVKVLEFEAAGRNEFEHMMWTSSGLMNMSDGIPDLHYSIDPRFKFFWEQIWPVFIEHLKQEINEQS